jgi:superfamily II DNA or RNA helicase
LEVIVKVARKSGSGLRTANVTKYDIQNKVLEKTYGALADLRRELADSKVAIEERRDLLGLFAECHDSQRAWLLLEDYFSKLSLARKDFPSNDWWPRMMSSRGKGRLEELALLFLRANRSLPSELIPCANLERLAQVEAAEAEERLVMQLEDWLFPTGPMHLDQPRATLRVTCQPSALADHSPLHRLHVDFHLFRPRTGEKGKALRELIELTARSSHEQELFSPGHWGFIQWLAETYGNEEGLAEPLQLSGLELLRWLAKWGNTPYLVLNGDAKTLKFHGQMAELIPHLKSSRDEMAFTHKIKLSSGDILSLAEVRFFDGQPTFILAGETFYLLRNAPRPELLRAWLVQSQVSVQKLSHRFLAELRKRNLNLGADWDKICVAHPAVPQFVFELNETTVHLRLIACSQRDKSRWQWNGHEWQRLDHPPRVNGKPEFLDDSRLEPATQWLRKLDWFTPEPGLWIGDATENFLATLASVWPERPKEAEYLGNPAFQRLFLSPHPYRPQLVVHGSGIDWFTVSAEWEQEGLRLTPADLQYLANATGRFVKLPDSGWIELDIGAVQQAHETLADLGVDGLVPIAQQVNLLHASQMSEATFQLFGDQPEVKALRRRVAEFKGIPAMNLPAGIKADMRPYQREGFDFLCHLSRMHLGGILADDMGLGKTLQTLAWIAWLKDQHPNRLKPCLVICPASVLHNWRREANRFAPDLKVLVLESGAARHNLRQQIPQHDLIVTNYALLRRDLPSLQKFEFRAVVLDEAQFIKNPAAQVTQSVKQLRGDQRLALTGTPLENRLLDLWSILDFVQPGYLGTQSQFEQNYETRSNDPAAQSIGRRRMSAKLRPLLLRRLKQQVAKDLPDRIEERRDCVLGDAQRKLYLAELRRSREQVLEAVEKQGLARSKMHVLAALTRLRQICCHPTLVGNDAASGKTETLFELLEPLLSDGQKVLVFSQFVQMLKLIEGECQQRQIPTHLLTGETKNRHQVVQQFQDDHQGAVFLLSLRAAGTGLNLTTASYVVLYDPWWNPAVEAQAIDRSHRIGQTRTVVAFRLISPGTVEEKIWELQQRKAQTIKDVLGEAGFARSLSRSDLEYLFAED